ncbi:MAG TPA: hypothetical protein VHD15_11465 [Hyphomicrobiales bacterium]|nr:hypothetical protein [Hyphomicrobiales bacterium]
MSISPAGLLVCLGLLALGWRLGAPLVVPMFAALAFGSTAVATLSALGGSSPQIYVVFAAAFLVATLLRRRLLADLRALFVTDWTASIVVILLVYVAASSFILPRLFAGQTTAFVPSEGRIVEVMLAPSNGNVTQVAYFALGCLSYFTVSVALLRHRNLDAFRLGFFSFALFNAALGLIDLAGKMGRMGDLLLPIRTASYQLLTNVEESGFWRIAGGFAEASGFAAAALACLGFAFCYWRAGGGRAALMLTLVLLALVLLSTSSTAYVSLALVATPVALGLLLRGLAGRLVRRDLVVMAIIAVCLVAGVAVAILQPSVVDQIVQLFQSTLLDKAQSSSGQERSYWNSRSITALFDTDGLGVGFGSSRASSWAVALLSQTGLIGALLVALLLLRILPPLKAQRGDDVALIALHGGARGAVLAGLVAIGVSSGSADPGLLFFVGLAVCNACRREVMARRLPRRARAAAAPMPFIPRPARAPG